MASWYKNSREGFLKDGIGAVVDRLHEAAAEDAWQIDSDQDTEWRQTIGILKKTLQDPSFDFVTGVLAEYDFRRRGIRIDFVLVAAGALFVLEFKRGETGAADRDQVMNYCINLVEFHEFTQQAKPKLFPILVSRQSTKPTRIPAVDWQEDWAQIYRYVVSTKAADLGATLRQLYSYVDHAGMPFSYQGWDQSPFQPSSTIIDAVISLYGQHDVSAIKEHAVPQENIDKCFHSVVAEIEAAHAAKRHEIIIVSGAPGAGKTLVGLRLAFHKPFRSDAVFVTGNTPLVKVLNGSLKRSYLGLYANKRTKVLGGYTRGGVKFVTKNTDFKIVSANRFLEAARGRRGLVRESGRPESTDGGIMIFDEAQRTYAKGQIVNRHELDEDEALLITDEMSHRSGSILVLLMGHNQHINTNEMGAIAWLGAAKAKGWSYAVSDETLALEEFTQDREWKTCPLRVQIEHTHLSHSMRDQKTRNGELERWAHCVMTNQPGEATQIAQTLQVNSAIWITRELSAAKQWANNRRQGEDRCGLIGSGQGFRLRADGIFVGEKPEIVPWMLEPSGDVRSSNMLEQTQNQYQIQGLEIDYAIVCWDADLRREASGWSCYKLNGAGWTAACKEHETRCNSYRVLLTRSRKGMVLFVPTGDLTGEDRTREPAFYNGIADYLVQCGARVLQV